MKLVPETQQARQSGTTLKSLGLAFVRYGIGSIMMLAGLVVLIAVPGDLGAYGFASAIGAGGSVLLLNFLFRMSVSGERDREREEQVRRYFDEHGVWPDDEEPRTTMRHWTLPAGAVTAQQEQRERQRVTDRATPTAVS
jgi:hypothetical protein